MRTPTITRRLLRLASEINAEILLEPYGFAGCILFANGQRSMFRDTSFNINPVGSMKIAKDKGHTSFFLRRFGFCVPDWELIFSNLLNEHLTEKKYVTDGIRFAQQSGFPVVVKPNDKSKGEGVAKVFDQAEFLSASEQILSCNHVMQVQKFCPGNDYRIVVLDGEVISAYQRIPLAITGDGLSSVTQLLISKQNYFRESGRDTLVDIVDPRTLTILKRSGLAPESIPLAGERIHLLDNANLSSGGDAIDFTDGIHDSFRQLAVDISRAMCLNLCGVDIITEDISEPARNYHVIEINSAPGLDNYASLGTAQNERVDGLYRKILISLQNGNRREG